MKAKLSIVFDDLAGSAGSVTAKGNNAFTSLLCRPFGKDQKSNRKSQQREGWRNWGIMWESMTDEQREQWNAFIEDGNYWDEPLNKAPKTGRELFFQACIAKYWSGRTDYMNYTSLYKNNLTCLPVVESIPETGDIFMYSDGDKFQEGQLVKVWISKPGTTQVAWDWHNMYLLGYFIADEMNRFNIRDALEDRFYMTLEEYYHFNYAVQLFSGEQLHRSSMFWENGRMALFEKPKPPNPMPDSVVRPYSSQFSSNRLNLVLSMDAPYQDDRYYYEVWSTNAYDTIGEARAANKVMLGVLATSKYATYNLIAAWNNTFGKPAEGKIYYIMEMVIIDKEGEYDTEVWECNGLIPDIRYFSKLD